MSFKSSIKSMIDTIVEFDNTMMTDCIACERRVPKPKHGKNALCDTCHEKGGLGAVLLGAFFGAERPQSASSAVLGFMDRNAK